MPKIKIVQKNAKMRVSDAKGSETGQDFHILNLSYLLMQEDIQQEQFQK